MRETQFAHLLWCKRSREGRQWESGSGGLQRRRWWRPVALWLQGLLWWQWCRHGLDLQEMDWNGGSGVMAQWWRRGSAMAARVWAKFTWDRGLFRGGFDPTHRWDGVLQFLSSNRTQILLRLEDIVKGVIYGLVMIREWTPDRVGGNPIKWTGLAWTLGRLQLGVRLAVLSGLARLALSR
jgi:hypothetical protein